MGKPTGKVVSVLAAGPLGPFAPVFENERRGDVLGEVPGGGATGLLATGGVIWATNVIAFGLWYWDLDRGGAAARAHHPCWRPRPPSCC